MQNREILIESPLNCSQHKEFLGSDVKREGGKNGKFSNKFFLIFSLALCGFIYINKQMVSIQGIGKVEDYSPSEFYCILFCHLTSRQVTLPTQQ